MKLIVHPWILAFLACFPGAFLPLAAQDASLETSYRSQSQIQRQAKQIVAHIDAIIFDYTRNGLQGEELEALKRTRQKLSESSDAEMAQILELLATAKSGGEGEEKLLEAFEGQKGVLSVLRNLMTEYNERRDMASVPLILRSIVERQESNLAAAVQLARSINPSRGLSDFQTRMVDAQYEEQRGINQQFGQWVASMEVLAFSPEEETAARFQNTLRAAQRMGVSTLLGQSLEALDSEQVVTATSFEKRAVDSLKQLLLSLDKETSLEPDREESFDLAAELRRIREEEAKIRQQIDKRLEKDQNLNPVVRSQGSVVQSFFQLRDAMIERMPDKSDLHTTVLDTMRLARREMGDSAPSRRAQSARTVDRVIAQLDSLIDLVNGDASTAGETAETMDEETFAQRLAQAVEEQERLNNNTLSMERSGRSIRGAQARQETIAQMTSILHDQARVSYPETARPLFDAEASIKSVIENLALSGREGLAIMGQESALNHLRQALDSLKTDEEEYSETDPSLLADAIANAQEDLEEAETAIAEEDFEEAGEALEEAVETVAEAEALAAAMDPAMIPEDLQTDLEEAQAALADALAALPTASGMEGEEGQLADASGEGDPSPLAAALAAANAALSDAAEGAQESGENQEGGEFLEAIASQLAQGAQANPTGEEGGQDSPPQPPQASSTTPITDTESDGEGEGEYNSTGPEIAGTPGELADGSAFTALPERDREAIRQSMSEPHPAAYRDFIEQYRRNLANSIQ